MNTLHKITFGIALTALCLPLTATADRDGAESRVGDRQSEYGERATQQKEKLNRDTVLQIQRQLRSEGHTVDVDGVWGPETSQALKKFQESENINATGRPDSQTLARLGVQSTDRTERN